MDKNRQSIRLSLLYTTSLLPRPSFMTTLPTPISLGTLDAIGGVPIYAYPPFYFLLKNEMQ
jgi:hypothetical protein